MKRSPAVKRCHVTVEGRTITVSAVSAYFAAMAYHAEANCPSLNPLPTLNDLTVLRVREVGQRRIYPVVWKEVVEWANREADIAFSLAADSIPALPATSVADAYPLQQARPREANPRRQLIWRTAALANNF